MTFKLPKFLNPSAMWLEKQQTSILSAATIMTSASMLSAVAGLLIKRLLNHYFIEHHQESLEAFWLAFQIPDMMFQLIILGALSAAFIPIFTSYKKKSYKKAFHMSSIMMNILLLVFLGVGVFVFIFAREITEFRTGAQISPEQIDVVVNLTRLMLLAQFFFAISNFMTGILQSFQRFIIPALSPIFYNLGIILGVVFFSSKLGIYSAGVGVVIGSFLHMAIQIPLVYKLGFNYSFSLNFKYPGIKQFFKIMPPRVFAIGASEIRKLALGYFTTSLGSLSYLTMFYALTLMTVPIRLFGVPIGQASLPFLSEKSGKDERGKFIGLVLQSLNQISFLTFPASVLLLILRIPAVRLVFGTRDFPWTTTVLLGKLVAILAISITVQALAHLLNRAFYALKDTKTPLLIAGVDLVIYFSLSYFFVFHTGWGVIGIAISTVLTAFTELIFLILFLNKKVGGIISRALWVPQLKMIVAAFFMAVSLYLPFRVLDELVFNTTKTIELIALSVTTGTIGMVVYLYFAALLNIRELKIVLDLINNFGPWRKILAKSEEVLLETGVEGEEL
jgi:putative peptidoglycan lipid II flippase